MDVTIQERAASLHTEYDISAPGGVYYAMKEMFTLFNRVEVRVDEGRVIARLEGQFSVLRNKYGSITFSAPISGRAFMNAGAGTICSLSMNTGD